MCNNKCKDSCIDSWVKGRRVIQVESFFNLLGPNLFYWFEEFSCYTSSKTHQTEVYFFRDPFEGSWEYYADGEKL